MPTSTTKGTDDAKDRQTVSPHHQKSSRHRDYAIEHGIKGAARRLTRSQVSSPTMPASSPAGAV